MPQRKMEMTVSFWAATAAACVIARSRRTIPEGFWDTEENEEERESNNNGNHPKHPPPP